jgi:peroxiredoxin (alkyl hydroperoxide reductase subunit C)
MIKINAPAPDFTEEAYRNDQIKKTSLKDYRGKWVVLFFYPADFSYVCPTELGDLADHDTEIKTEGAEVISVTVGTGYVHKAWHDASETLKKIKYPKLSDPAHSLKKDCRCEEHFS